MWSTQFNSITISSQYIDIGTVGSVLLRVPLGTASSVAASKSTSSVFFNTSRQ